MLLIFLIVGLPLALLTFVVLRLWGRPIRLERAVEISALAAGHCTVALHLLPLLLVMLIRSSIHSSGDPCVDFPHLMVSINNRCIADLARYADFPVVHRCPAYSVGDIVFAGFI
jgi:hypothetical protein